MERTEADSSMAMTSQADDGNDRVKLNVGGKLFETTLGTLQSGGPDSLLAALSLRAPAEGDRLPIFIDRDPDIFAALLSLLRSGRLPSAAFRRFSKQELIDEALYYGLESHLRSALAPPPLLGVVATLVATVSPASDGLPTALSAGAQDGSLWIAHGGQISAYDWSLFHAGTVRTHLDTITSIRRAWPDVAAVGSLGAPGLHFYDVSSGRHVGSAHWSDPSDPRVYKARVTAMAVAASDDPSNSIFAAFECSHRENCILALDRNTLQVVSEIGRQSGGALRSTSPGKLLYIADRRLVFASALNAGAFGYSGYMRLWDPRSGDVVWETSEPGSGGLSSRFGDSFADVDVDNETTAIYKVCWKSGDVGVADMRRLGDNPWVYLEEQTAGVTRAAGGGNNSVLHCYKKQVFVSRETGLEVWSQAGEVEEDEEEDEGQSCSKDDTGGSIRNEKTMRRYMRNFVDTEADAKRGLILRMEAGGDRLFVSRRGVEGIEVWESSDLSGAISLV